MHKEEFIYIGSWGADIQGINKPTAGDGGIKAYKVVENKYFELIGKVTPEINIGSMVISKDQKNLYATNERKDLGGVHGQGGGIASYKIENDGKLVFLNEVSSAGAYPCYIAADSRKQYVFTCNHGNHEEVTTRAIQLEDGSFEAKRIFDEGSIAMFPILPDGSLGKCCELIKLEGESVLPLFQWTSHPHSVCLSPDEKYLLSADKGSDLIRVYEIDYDKGKLRLICTKETEKGSGPRHIEFHPTWPIFYCNSEQNHTVHSYWFNFERGEICHLNRAITVSSDYQPKKDVNDIFAHNQTADLKIHHSGRYLYVSNRGDNSIACYLLNNQGEMKLIEIISSSGEIPRAINFDSSGENLFVVNQRTGTINKFLVDIITGKIKNTKLEINVNNPVSIQFLEKKK